MTDGGRRSMLTCPGPAPVCPPAPAAELSLAPGPRARAGKKERRQRRRLRASRLGDAGAPLDTASPRAPSARTCLPRSRAARERPGVPRGQACPRGAGDQRGAAACWSSGSAGSGAPGTLRGAARPGLLRTAVLSNSQPPPLRGPAPPEDPVRICEERNVMKKEQKRAVIVGERGVFFPRWWLLHDWKGCT
ncbi:CASP-like protein 4U1 [Myotis lucifugus]|uniref:CASP-like protein 4U1 n=1 Tax=Myotis lucifugus TaxID=59463 RepID=UPI000CCC0F6B|nr:CASP-like protein 4U1 [Myotis lucifugus]